MDFDVIYNKVVEAVPDKAKDIEAKKYFMAGMFQCLSAVIAGLEEQGFLPDFSWNYAQHKLSEFGGMINGL